MKFSFFTVVMPLALMLTACDKQEEKFAGFSAVSMDQKTANFFIDTNTIKRSRNGTVSFNMIRKLSEGYVIQNASTDCENDLKSLEGVKYLEDGTSQERFASETFALPPNKDNTEVVALVTLACDKAEKDRIITGDFDEGKALEILHDEYHPIDKTATWKNINPPSSIEGYEKFPNNSGIVKILASENFTQDDNTKHVLLTSTSNRLTSDVLLSATVFVKKSDEWLIEKDYPYLTITKETTIAHWQRIGKNSYGIVVEVNDYMGNKNAFLFDVNNSEKLLELDSSSYGSLTFSNYDKEHPDLTVTIGSNEDIYRFINGKYEFLGSGNLNSFQTRLLKEFEKNGRTKIWIEQSFKDEKNEELHVVFTETHPIENGRDCDYNACAANIGQITYKQINGAWIVISQKQKIAEIGGSGQAPLVEKPLQILKLPSNKLLFLAHNEVGYQYQDHTSTIHYLWVFSKNNWSFVGYLISSVEYIGCSYSTTKCFNYKGTLSIIPSKKEYPDLLLTKTGTELDDNSNTVTAKNSLYIYNGKEYIEKINKKNPSVKNENLSNDNRAIVTDSPAKK
ncbi:MAG: hypothetical protein Q8Q50_03525 [Methylobacter sp.]|nr:hypothetical protein [Methylobacter sp.]